MGNYASVDESPGYNVEQFVELGNHADNIVWLSPDVTWAVVGSKHQEMMHTMLLDQTPQQCSNPVYIGKLEHHSCVLAANSTCAVIAVSRKIHRVDRFGCIEWSTLLPGSVLSLDPTRDNTRVIVAGLVQMRIYLYVLDIATGETLHTMPSIIIDENGPNFIQTATGHTTSGALFIHVMSGYSIHVIDANSYELKCSIDIRNHVFTPNFMFDKDDSLLAAGVGAKIDIYSMQTGVHVIALITDTDEIVRAYFHPVRPWLLCLSTTKLYIYRCVDWGVLHTIHIKPCDGGLDMIVAKQDVYIVFKCDTRLYTSLIPIRNVTRVRELPLCAPHPISAIALPGYNCQIYNPENIIVTETDTGRILLWRSPYRARVMSFILAVKRSRIRNLPAELYVYIYQEFLQSHLD
jgi:hypothetical protein